MHWKGDLALTVRNNNVKIHVENLTKNFGQNKVLCGISTDIYEGEVVCVIGPSGSGKSTFLRCLNRLETARYFRPSKVLPVGTEITIRGLRA